jgi:hypothetical protein
MLYLIAFYIGRFLGRLFRLRKTPSDRNRNRLK